MGTTTRWTVRTALVLAIALSLTAPAAGAATTKAPKTAKAVAGLLAAKKLGCRRFASASTSSGGSSSSLPSGLSQLTLLLRGADLGTCTIGGQQTLLVAFPSASARESFEGTLADLPCAVVKSALPSSATPASGASSGAISLPLVDLGARAVVFSTGTAPDSDQLDLAQAASADAKIAAKAGGHVRTLTYQCN